MRAANYTVRVTMVLLCVPVALRALGGDPQYELIRSTVSSTDATVGMADGYELRGHVGHLHSAEPGGDGYTLNSGYFHSLAPTDCDADGSVSLLDYGDLAMCLDGPASSLATGCDCFDVNRNGAVELADFAMSQVAFAGP